MRAVATPSAPFRSCSPRRCRRTPAGPAKTSARAPKMTPAAAAAATTFGWRNRTRSNAAPHSSASEPWSGRAAGCHPDSDSLPVRTRSRPQAKTTSAGATAPSYPVCRCRLEIGCSSRPAAGTPAPRDRSGRCDWCARVGSWSASPPSNVTAAAGSTRRSRIGMRGGYPGRSGPE